MTEPLALAGKPTKDEIQEMVRLHVVERLSLSQVGKRVGRSTSSVKGFVARNRQLALATEAPPAPREWVRVVPEDEVTVWTHPETGKLVSLPRLRCIEDQHRRER